MTQDDHARHAGPRRPLDVLLDLLFGLSSTPPGDDGASSDSPSRDWSDDDLGSSDPIDDDVISTN